MRLARLHALLLPGLLAALGPGLQAATLRVAVASNFADTLRALAEPFRARTSHELALSVGSTGKLFAQIHHGAPFDLFLAADAARPRRLEEAGVGVPGTRATYATGRLVLWVPGLEELPDPEAWLRRGDFPYLALANPRLAPYGRAARELLAGLGVWETLQTRLVRGENIGQAYQFVASGAAPAGLVAHAQVRRPGSPARGAVWEVPVDRHAPVEQQLLLLREGPAGRAFLAFLRGPEARELLEAAGYLLPAAPGEGPPR